MVVAGEKRRANDLDGKTWLRSSISIWSDITKTPEERQLARIHPALFPKALARRVIECYTRVGATVLDSFAGVGSAVLAAQESGRRGIGIELNPAFVELAQTRLAQRPLLEEDQPFPGRIIQGNARELAHFLTPSSVDLVVTSPPYWNILLKKRTIDHKVQRDYGEAGADLGKVDDYQEFLTVLREVFFQVYEVLRPGGYVCVNVMDLRRGQTFYPLHQDVSDFMRALGFLYTDLILWDRRQEYNALGPIGYPVVFLINKVHEYLLLFRKPVP